MTVYSDDPVSVAQKFSSFGAEWVHLVDLEGARDGNTPNFSVIRDIASKTDIHAEIGGGIRSEDTICKYLDCGIDRVILGTIALQDPDFLRRMIEKYGDRIAVGVDLRNGMVATHGWNETSSVSGESFLKQLALIGVSTVIITDISRDGAMKGPNVDLYRQLSEVFPGNITASGGVSSIEDLKALRELSLYGAILGKAYYSGAVDLKEALEVTA